LLWVAKGGEMASAIAWRSASAVAGLIVGKLGKLAVSQATPLWSFKEDIDDLRETMEKLQAWMHDADERSTKDQGRLMGFWMKKLKSGAYDVEDLLDQFEAAELMKQSQHKVLMLNFIVVF
jgi:hypothetical protein